MSPSTCGHRSIQRLRNTRRRSANPTPSPSSAPQVSSATITSAGSGCVTLRSSQEVYAVGHTCTACPVGQRDRPWLIRGTGCTRGGLPLCTGVENALRVLPLQPGNRSIQTPLRRQVIHAKKSHTGGDRRAVRPRSQRPVEAPPTAALPCGGASAGRRTLPADSSAGRGNAADDATCTAPR